MRNILFNNTTIEEIIDDMKDIKSRIFYIGNKKIEIRIQMRILKNE